MHKEDYSKLGLLYPMELPKINDGYVPGDNEFHHDLMSFDDVTLHNKGEEYIARYDSDSNYEPILLNPHIELVNGTDLLIKKKIPNGLLLNYRIKFKLFKRSNTGNIFEENVKILIETSTDGVIYKEKFHFRHDILLIPNFYKNIFLFTMMAFLSEFPVGTYIRLKVLKIGENKLKIVTSTPNSFDCGYSVNLSLRLDI